MAYLRFILGNLRSLSYGFLLALFSTFGQTAFIAVYGREVMALYGLTPGEYGLIYMAATLTSAGLMIHAGKQIDSLPRGLFTGIILAGISLACFAMFLQGFFQSLVFLYLTLLLLRLFGQGLMSHASMTAMARDFNRNRGKALSLAAMGHAPGEAFFPLIAVGLMALIGWRESWLAYALFCLFAVLPLLLWLSAKPRVPRSGAEAPPTDEEAQAAKRGWTRAQVLRDPAFYLLLPALFASPCLGTGLFFHQVPLVEDKGWALTDFAAAFPTFALATTLFGLLGGKLVDARSARWLLQFALWPMAAGFALIGWAESPLAPHGLMILMGATVGINHTISTALWAELYGLAHLGAIRALSSSFMVFSTSLGPAAMGLLLDGGLSMSGVMLLAALWVAATALLQPLVFTVILRRRPELAAASAAQPFR